MYTELNEQIVNLNYRETTMRETTKQFTAASYEMNNGRLYDLVRKEMDACNRYNKLFGKLSKLVDNKITIEGSKSDLDAYYDAIFEMQALQNGMIEYLKEV
jgi:hypothetical protein